MNDDAQQQPIQPEAVGFIPGQMATPGSYRWWFFPLPTQDGKHVVQCVVQTPGGDTHLILTPEDCIRFGSSAIENGRKVQNMPHRLIVPEVQLPTDFLKPNGQH